MRRAHSESACELFRWHEEELKLAKRERDEAERKYVDKRERLKQVHKARVSSMVERNRQELVQAATMVIQRWVRGFLARRRVRTLKREINAAVKLQAHVRSWRARRQFSEKKRKKAATIIQARVRGFLAKRAFDRDMRRLIICQNLVRKYFAQKKLKKLKIEAMNPTGIGTTLHSNSAPPFEYSTAPLCHCDWCMRQLGQNQGSLGINLSSTSACLRTTYSSTIDRLWTIESLWNEVLLNTQTGH